MSVGAGIAGAAGIGVLGSFLGSGQQDKYAKRAADTQLEMYERTRRDLAPYRKVGYAALGVLANMFIPGYSSDTSSQVSALEKERKKLLSTPTRASYGAWSRRDESLPAGFRGGREQREKTRWQRLVEKRMNRIEGGGARIDRGRLAEIDAEISALRAQESSGEADYSSFYKSPGYEFRMGEGVRALDRSASARGKLRSGAHERGLIRYGQGVASSEFNQYANRLASLAGLGQTASAQTGSFGATAAAQAGQYIQNRGTARGSGYVGAANAMTQGIGNYLFYAGL